MKESYYQEKPDVLQGFNYRVLGIALAVMMATVTFPDCVCLFFAFCAWVAWSDKPERKECEEGNSENLTN